MVAGIVLFAFAMEATLAHVSDKLDPVSAFALCVGPALPARVRCAAYCGSGDLGRGRLVAAITCAALFPIALVVPALVALAFVAAVWVAFHAYEILWWREARAETRSPRRPAAQVPQA